MPTRAEIARLPDDADLIVNSSFRYQPEHCFPDEIVRRALPVDGFLRDYPIAWVADPGTGIWAPFWARQQCAEALQRLTAGKPAPADLPPALRRTFALANILVAPDYETTRLAHWDEICESARAEHDLKGHVVIQDLIHPLQRNAMQRYYRALVADGRLPLGDSQVAERFGLHSEVLANFLHPQLTDLISRVAGDEVKPSYVYFASYRPGADLPPHRDREQCEFSVSLLVDYSPDPDGSCGWPLFMHHPAAPDIVHAADLGIGDALIYRGRELVHYREPLPAGHQSTSLFLHYVRKDFTGRLC
ncbi:MAG TPA: hypothetical protein VM164_05140 [Burkholderiales bacterium]|nr:hypothetical protein [Burkholderiales bacterium]